MGEYQRCAALAALVEPDPGLREAGHAQPALGGYGDGIWHIWPQRAWTTTPSTASMEVVPIEDRFRLRVAFAVDRAGETDDPDPEISKAISAAVDRLRAAVLGNRALAGQWEWIAVAEVDYEALSGKDHRGFLATVEGRSYSGDGT